MNPERVLLDPFQGGVRAYFYDHAHMPSQQSVMFKSWQMRLVVALGSRLDPLRTR